MEPKMERFEVAELKKGLDFYSLVINADDNSVSGILYERGDASAPKEFNKGKRGALFGAIELAKKIHTKMLEDGWESVEVNFSSVAEKLYEQQLAGKDPLDMFKEGVTPKESPPVRRNPAIKELLKEKPATLAQIAGKDLEETFSARKQKSA